MKILFLKIPSMKYYKGAVSGEDMPFGAGGTALEPDIVYEKYNFDPVKAPNGEFCLGYFDAGEDELHIENIEGTGMEDDTAENVLVIWCAEYTDGRTTVVGWYGDASVGRYYDALEFDGGYTQTYNIVDDAENCVLLPFNERGSLKWNIPVKNSSSAFGISRANIWFASEKEAGAFIENLAGEIGRYNGENWLHRYPSGQNEV